MYIHIDIRTHVGADDRTIQLKNRTGHCRRGVDKTGQDRTEQDRRGQERTVLDRRQV